MLKLSKEGHSMISGLWGKKIGMTQVFHQDKVVPVTVINVNNWIVIQVKTAEKDGYSAVKLGLVRKQFHNDQFSAEWLKKPATYFSMIKEVPWDGQQAVTVGQSLLCDQVLEHGKLVDAFGWTIGRGFAGAIKRHGFAGGRASHGSKVGRKPGASGSFRSQGKVIKGKRFPGHMGTERRMQAALEVIQCDPQANIILVKGSMPGKAGSLVFLRKR